MIMLQLYMHASPSKFKFKFNVQVQVQCTRSPTRGTSTAYLCKTYIKLEKLKIIVQCP